MALLSIIFSPPLVATKLSVTVEYTDGTFPNEVKVINRHTKEELTGDLVDDFVEYDLDNINSIIPLKIEATENLREGYTLYPIWLDVPFYEKGKNYSISLMPIEIETAKTGALAVKDIFKLVFHEKDEVLKGLPEKKLLDLYQKSQHIADKRLERLSDPQTTYKKYDLYSIYSFLKISTVLASTSSATKYTVTDDIYRYSGWLNSLVKLTLLM